MRVTRKHGILAVLGAGLAGLLYVMTRPDPVQVDVAVAAHGPLRVTVDEDGVTRVKHYVDIAAPAAGRFVPDHLDEGDAVEAGRPIGTLYPAPLDPRGREQAEARLQAAEAGQREAAARVAQARAGADDARRRRERVDDLAAGGQVSREELDRAHTAERLATSELEAATFRARAAAFDATGARAALHEGATARRLVVRAPVAGRVFRVFERNERVVAAGSPLVRIGNPGDLEVVIDVLSDDAVRMRPGAAMWLHVGGEAPVAGRARLVEPSGFTKVSPLGVEEQRVNVIGDFTEPPAGLGDGYRVDAHIVVWEGQDVLTVPAGALFRASDGTWAVFVLADGIARHRTVHVGERTPIAVQILNGLTAGEAVVLHPGDRVRDGIAATVAGR